MFLPRSELTKVAERLGEMLPVTHSYPKTRGGVTMQDLQEWLLVREQQSEQEGGLDHCFYWGFHEKDKRGLSNQVKIA